MANCVDLDRTDVFPKQQSFIWKHLTPLPPPHFPPMSWNLPYDELGPSIRTWSTAHRPSGGTMKNVMVAFLAVCVVVLAIFIGVKTTTNHPDAVPNEPARAIVAPEQDLSEEYWTRLVALRQHAHALHDQIAALEESNKQFDGPEYNPCLADAQGGVGRCVSEQASALESLHRLLTEAIATEREALESTDQYRARLIRQRKFLLAHGGGILPNDTMLQKLAKEGVAIQQALLQS